MSAMQRSLFGDEPGRSWEEFAMPDAEVSLLRSFIAEEAGRELLDALIRETPWRQDKIRVFGAEHDLPRLQQWFGDEGRTYRWSGIVMEPLPWSPALLRVRARVQEVVGAAFNSVLLNYYRDGDDTVGWHSDDEPELGPTPLIASVSLGAERDFVLRHKERDNVDQLRLPLPHGSLLLMQGPTQRFWQHCLPRRRRVREPRVNLTFRAFGAGS